MAKPSFAETDKQGHPMQQDAEEFFTTLIQAIKNNVRIDAQDGTDNKKALVDDLFQLETISTYKNKEVPEDPEQ